MNNSNNFKQPEALHLADYLEFSHHHAEHSPEFIAAGELRRLYAEVDRLSYQLAYPDNFVKEPEQEPVAIADGTFNHNCPVGTLLYTSPPAQRKPLTDEELYKVFPAIATYTEANKTLYRSIARAIEAAIRARSNT